MQDSSKPDPATPPAAADPAISRLLRAVQQGADGAADELLQLVYDELRRMAQHKLGRLAPGQTLQATALVHEAWLKLRLHDEPDFHGRAHFFGAAARAMRNVLVDQARRKGALRRGGAGTPHVSLELGPDAEPAAAAPSLDDALAVDEALRRLERAHARKVQLVELRVYAGLSMPEIAEVLGIGLATAERDWAFARAWLARALADGGDRGGGGGDGGEPT